jgi:hypothetical protein
MIPKNKIDLTIRIKLLIIDSMTLLNYIFDTNRVDNQFDLFWEYIYQANKGLYNLNPKGLFVTNAHVTQGP